MFKDKPGGLVVDYLEYSKSITMLRASLALVRLRLNQSQGGMYI